jgi:hypothetical protein
VSIAQQSLEIPLELKEVEVGKGTEFTLDLEILHGSSRGPITEINVRSYKEVHVIGCGPGQYGLNAAGWIIPGLKPDHLADEDW